jgi:hypothetical protein
MLQGNDSPYIRTLTLFALFGLFSSDLLGSITAIESLENVILKLLWVSYRE